jgi:hypothetical protein
VLQLDGQTYRCYANDICPCLEKQIAIRDSISSFRCDEHVDVLYDPADPRICRRVEFVGLRSDREEREGPLGMALCAGGVGFIAYRIHTWRKRRGRRGTAAVSQ